MKNSILFLFLTFSSFFIFGQNPLIMDQYTADPSARVFQGKVYIYPSHDIRKETSQFSNWFCMEDYHVFSSENLTEWEDHGMILSQNNVSWVDTATYSMWAPDCIEKNGKYYFYFPSSAKDKSEGYGRRIGVAISDSPLGSFEPETAPMKGVFGIDPNPFIDKDGQCYIYWAGGGKLYVAKLKENMLELATEPQEILNLPAKFKEGPFLFERNGKYYFTYPFVPETTEQLVYAMGDNPMGPFEYKGVIMDESPTHCWTNHQSIIEYNKQWYLFYHHNDLSPYFDKNRSIRADSLFFKEDGTIQKVIPTWRGVGISSTERKIQIDRYSAVSDKGISVEFIDTLNRYQGWKITLEKAGAWVRYNKVDFNNPALKNVQINAKTITGGSFEIRLNALDGPILANVNLSHSNEWKLSDSNLEKYIPGIHDLFVVLKSSAPVEIDWVKFE